MSVRTVNEKKNLGLEFLRHSFICYFRHLGAFEQYSRYSLHRTYFRTLKI